MSDPSASLLEPGQKLILLVDDDDSILDLLDAMVKREGFRTERVSDGLEAVRKAETLSPDLIVLDLMLPAKGGLEIARELQMSEARAIPIIVVTGRRMDRNALDLIRREPNVKECFDKPIKASAFVSLLHSLLKTRAPERQRKPDRGPLSGSW